MINCFKLELNRKMKMDEAVAKAKEAAALGYNMIDIQVRSLSKDLILSKRLSRLNPLKALSR